MTQSSRIPETPMAESTRVPLKTSTDKREVKEKKELFNIRWITRERTN